MTDSQWRQPPGSPRPTPSDPGVSVIDATVLPVSEVVVPQRACLKCGGVVDTDGYCGTCGAKAPREREHFVVAPAPWLAGVCDRGIAHACNEDALAASADETPGAWDVAVVCDGVSTSVDSDVASMAAVTSALKVLTSAPGVRATKASRRAEIVGHVTKAAAAANDATVAASDSAACTFVAVVVTEGCVYAGNLGDSRAYWLPDLGEPMCLTTDDSVAEHRVGMGIPRAVAEESEGAHTITRWLGADALDVVPRVASFEPPSPGWVLVCSDGLWNYASEASVLKKVLTQAAEGVMQPQVIAEALVAWANEQGGHDNITVALIRVGNYGG